ncbi:1-acyl-sn-glycerol-3-phosphate acyltransferase alpha-like [Neocloeon triangulifer]|uniref:1-acyl-sn-glycerol-3-phosphate acyltransferase alpha-like n=1 Tax=Neocloeon triangulifer TaxID=2078957 RepID=UPI00286F0477|nr:1-acyl-sn-glycerol-3-phosphate acyltransferase alpha-like [Neocloeon triangulifer]XP_059481138.1 1-acyl-sn-glycerol-3-phosphate acyltransferase alpha-like [Neocloeon triangulifer]
MLAFCIQWLAFNWRTIVFYVFTSFFSLLGMPYFLLRPCNPINCSHWTRILRLSTYLVGIEWEVRGLEVLGQRRGCVAVANHQSSFDILGMFWFWRWSHLIAAVAKKEIFYAWPFGLAAWLAGVVFIDRINSDKARGQLAHAAKLMAEHDVKLWLFPEGTRNKRRRCLMPFKKGAFHVAVACQAPIMPVVYSPYYFINPHNNFHTGGKVIVTALPYVETKGLTMADVDDLMTKVRSEMEKVYQQVSEELKAELPPNYPGLVGFED